MKRLLYVVHRYAPFPGGSENYVRDMAEESVKRGHEVWVLTGEHRGNLNGVNVTSDANILGTPFDLIIVHGGDVGVQDFVLNNAQRIPSPILFMLILPSDSETYKRAKENVKYIGCSTIEDWEWVQRNNVEHKSKKIIHGIDPNISIGVSGFKSKFGINTPYMFLSCGGYWPNKAMKELADLFNSTGRTDTTLVLTGYDNRYGLMPEESEFVKPLLLDDRQDVMSAIVDADLYVMHSFKEGFGLVLLEAMLNKTPWAARYNAGARLMKDFGFTYISDDQILDYMKNFTNDKEEQINKAYNEINNNHLIKNTVDDIISVIEGN
jgi:glycosyltransferase involved in cell wall biosynthesis